MTPLSRQPHCLVYHATDPLAMINPKAERWLVDRIFHYRLVAEVAAPLERIYALTNHTTCDWTSRREVVWHLPDTPLRSTSVGDVVFCCTTGEAWLVMSRGYNKIVEGLQGGNNMGFLDAWELARRMQRTAIYYRDAQQNRAVIEFRVEEEDVHTVIANGDYGGSDLMTLGKHNVDANHHWSLIFPL